MRIPLLSSRHALNLLLVEDDEVDVMTVQRAIEQAHLAGRVWVAGDGLEAIGLLRGVIFPAERRLVLLDIHLPRMSGLELLREMRRDPTLRSVPVVVLGQVAEDRRVIERARLAVAGYLAKPVTAVALIEVVRALRRYGVYAE
jgi:CheY-like chemotaxis protein